MCVCVWGVNYILKTVQCLQLLNGEFGSFLSFIKNTVTLINLRSTGFYNRIKESCNQTTEVFSLSREFLVHTAYRILHQYFSSDVYLSSPIPSLSPNCRLQQCWYEVNDVWFPFSSAGVKAVYVLMMTVSQGGKGKAPSPREFGRGEQVAPPRCHSYQMRGLTGCRVRKLTYMELFYLDSGQK